MRRYISYILLAVFITGAVFFYNQNKIEHTPFINHHIAQKHIAKTQQQLQQRLQHENISAASSFYNSQIAQQVIEQAIVYNQDKIKRYLKHKNQHYLTINYQADYNIGLCLLREQSEPYTTNKVKVVIAAAPSSNNGYKIITAYPVP